MEEVCDRGNLERRVEARSGQQGQLRAWMGFTLPCGEREVSPPQELSGRCDCGPPRVHRRGAERAVRLG